METFFLPIQHIQSDKSFDKESCVRLALYLVFRELSGSIQVKGKSISGGIGILSKIAKKVNNDVI